MPLETVQDVVEYLADQAGVYGAHDDEDDEACETKPCRICWTEDVTVRIWKAVRLEQQLERGRTNAAPIEAKKEKTMLTGVAGQPKKEKTMLTGVAGQPMAPGGALNRSPERPPAPAGHMHESLVELNKRIYALVENHRALLKRIRGERPEPSPTFASEKRAEEPSTMEYLQACHSLVSDLETYEGELGNIFC